jgi:hypothetical protein
MGVSLDAFIADRDGEIEWTTPDEERLSSGVMMLRYRRAGRGRDPGS